MYLKELEIHAYDENDNFVFKRKTSVQDLVKNVEDYKNYYYRLGMFKNGHKTDRSIQRITHFGIQLTSHKEMRTTIEGELEYCLNKYIQRYEIKNKRKRKEDSTDYMTILLMYMDRYKSVMKKISKSSQKDVDRAISVFNCYDSRAKQITILNDLAGISGIYMLIFDSYNACYIGQARDMKKRIMMHWQRSLGTQVDIFRALDTTRIIALPLEEKEYQTVVDQVEYDLIKRIPSYVLLNTIEGGKPEWQIEKGIL